MGCFFFFFKQKTAYEIYQCDWSSDVCSSDLLMTDRLIILDTTLRDGEQAPGIALSPDDKVAIAHQLAKLQVDVIEAEIGRASCRERV